MTETLKEIKDKLVELAELKGYNRGLLDGYKKGFMDTMNSLAKEKEDGNKTN